MTNTVKTFSVFPDCNPISLIPPVLNLVYIICICSILITFVCILKEIILLTCIYLNFTYIELYYFSIATFVLLLLFLSQYYVTFIHIGFLFIIYSLLNILLLIAPKTTLKICWWSKVYWTYFSKVEHKIDVILKMFQKGKQRKIFLVLGTGLDDFRVVLARQKSLRLDRV